MGIKCFRRATMLLVLLSSPVLVVSAQAQPDRVFIQLLSSEHATIKWRGGEADAVCYSRKIKHLSKRFWRRCVNAKITAGGHKEAVLNRLKPDATYYYAIGPNKNKYYQFRTSPNINKPPADGNTRIWIVGDSGTQTEHGLHEGEAAQVLAGFESFKRSSGDEPVDLFLALGDNAYLEGTDAQWQKAFFEIYPHILSSAMVLPTIGNHEMGQRQIPVCLFDTRVSCSSGRTVSVSGASVSSDANSYDGDGDGNPDENGLPYLNIFSLPRVAEMGGVPSGTEQYYSADYANVHIVSLDSQLSARDPDQREAMRRWLISDLASNMRDWTIVIFHHPPYTKGANHDSDDANHEHSLDQPEWDMRNEFTPIFESYGVDLVYSGHAHSYERSYYLKGHVGTSDTFSYSQHVELNIKGNAALGYGRDSYHQLSPTSGNVDDRVVYTVAGSSGKADKQGGMSTTDDEWLRHPAHVPQPKDISCKASMLEGCKNGLAVKGSVVVDASKNTLTARFVDSHGDVLDQFSITRESEAIKDK